MNNEINTKYWLRIAENVGKASTCRLPVGCILVHRNTIVGMGYVGSVHGDYHCNEQGHIECEVDYRGQRRKTCIRTVHAEVNAILKCTVRGNKMTEWISCYSTHEPCFDCTKLLLQIGVRKIYFITSYEDERKKQYLSKINTNEFVDVSIFDLLLFQQVTL